MTIHYGGGVSGHERPDGFECDCECDESLEFSGDEQPEASPASDVAPSAKYGGVPDPTPAEIKAACREIQAGWDPREELARRVIVNPAARFHGLEGSAHVLRD